MFLIDKYNNIHTNQIDNRNHASENIINYNNNRSKRNNDDNVNENMRSILLTILE